MAEITSLYDSSLTYEQRALLRRKKRQEKGEMNLGLNGIRARSQSPTQLFRSLTSPTVHPTSPKEPRRVPMQNGSRGPEQSHSHLFDAHRNFSSPAILAQSRNGHVPLSSTSSLANGIEVSPNSNVSAGDSKQGLKGSSTSSVKEASPATMRKRLHTSPELPPRSKGKGATVTASKLELGTNGPNSRFSRLNSDSFAQPMSKVPPVPRANTVSNFTARPHSPLAVRLASNHLSSIIRKQQEYERSCSPSPSPLSHTPTPQAGGRPIFFTFPELDEKDSSNSVISKSISTETDSILLAQPSENSGTGSKESTSKSSSKSSSTDTELKSTPPVTTASEENLEVAADRGKGSISTSVERNSSVSDAKIMAEKNMTPSELIKLEETDGGRVSRQSNITSSSSFEFESFEASHVKTESEVQKKPSKPTPDSPDGERDGEAWVYQVRLTATAGEKTTFTYNPMQLLGGKDMPLVQVFGHVKCEESDEESERAPGSSVSVEEVACGGEGGSESLKSEKAKKKEGLKSRFRKKSQTDESPPNSNTRSSKKDKKKEKKEEGKENASSKEDAPELKRKEESKLSLKIQSKTKHDKDTSNEAATLASKPSVHTKTKPQKSSFRSKNEDKFSSCGWSKASLPNLFSPERSSRETTPENRMSDNERSKKSKEKKPSSLKRLSMSMRNLVRAGESSKSATTKTSWMFTEITDREKPADLYPAQSETQLSTLTDRDREMLSEDTELVPRTYSLGCLHSPHDNPVIGDSSIERPSQRTRADSTSDSEYLTASDSESVKDYVHSSVQIISCPSNTLAREAGYGKRLRNTSPSPLTTDSATALSPVRMPVATEGVTPALPIATRNVTPGSPIATKNVTPGSPVVTKSVTPKSPIATKSVIAGSSLATESNPVISPKASKKKSHSKTEASSPSKTPADQSSRIISPAKSKLSNPTKTSSFKQSTSSSSAAKARSKSTVNSPSQTNSNFTRFSPNRVPIRKISALTKSPSKSSLSDRVERIKQQQALGSPKSKTSPKQEVKAAAKRTPTSSPVTPRRGLPTAHKISGGRVPSPSQTSPQRTSTPNTPEQQRRKFTKSPLEKSSKPNTPEMQKRKISPKKPPPYPITPEEQRRTVPSLKLASPLRTPEQRRRKIGISLPSSPIASPCKQSPSHRSSHTEQEKDDSAMGMDVDTLLSSVGQKLGMLGGSSSTSESESLKLSSSVSKDEFETTESVLGPAAVILQPEPLSPPAIASMPAAPFSPTSPLHSTQSSMDLDLDPYDVFVTPDTSPLPSRHTTKPTGNIPLQEARKGKISPQVRATPATAGTPIKVKVQATEGPQKQKVVPIRATEVKHLVPPGRTSRGKVSPTPSKKEKVTTRRTTLASPQKPMSISAPARTLTSASKSDSKLPLERKTSAFTSALPPRPPPGRRSSDALPSPTRRVESTEKPRGTAASPGSQQTAKTSVAEKTTKLSAPESAFTRPTTGSTLRSSGRKQTSILTITASSENSVKPKPSSALDNKGSLTRSSIRGSGRLKKMSTPASPKRKVTTGSRPVTKVKSSDESLSVSKSFSSLLQRSIDSPVRQSMKSKSSIALVQSSSLRKGSIPNIASSVASRESKSLANSPIRHSMRRVSSGEIPRRIKPGMTATLPRRDKKLSQSSLNASMRGPKTSTVKSPLRGSTLTRSMRISSTSSGHRISTGTLPRNKTLPRSSTLGRISTTSLESSPGRGTLKRMSSGKEVFAAFDHISAQASVLSNPDHRRAVRPKMRQKASSSHLKMLKNRKDVSSELAPGHGNSSDASSKIDPNTYSTYMAKKNLAPSALAGLASKLDLTTVKLRKTGIVEHMLAEQAGEGGGVRPASPNPNTGTEHNTKHPVMLVQIKGRRQIQSRLAEPATSSLNSGDVFILISGKQLFHWVGKSANVIEKARGSDVVMRILHKKELGCQATQALTIKEEEPEPENTRRDAFWELLGGKRGVKAAEGAPSDEVHERAVNLATVVYQLEGEGEKVHFTPIHENCVQMVKVALLNTKKILLFDFVSEVYVWVGKQSPPAIRKKAVELGRKHFDKGCRPPVFTTNSPARASGRYRRSSGRSPRHGTLNSSGRRISKAARGEQSPRAGWALFARVNEGSESILFREKFADWPEPGRIIKMKGHISSGGVTIPTLTAELQPADVDKMLKLAPPFEGMRLEGDNIHRGQGNYKVSRSTFACNRVRTSALTKWVIKEFDNILVPEENHGIFYTSEAYVMRWGFIITVVRELEGLTPGQGPFAQDRAYQKQKQLEAGGVKKKKKAKRNVDNSDSESDADSDDECKRILESGGRDRCAYFFWQGETCTVNEKGASALMTVELDKEKGPQVRVVQGKEPPAFLNLFNGSMIILRGRSETSSLQSTDKECRFFCARVQARSEACLVEVDPGSHPIAFHLRSRGCYVLYHIPGRRLYLWLGSKITPSLKRAATSAAKRLRNRLQQVELVTVQEGEEQEDFCSLIGDKNLYLSLAKDSRPHNYTPRLFELSSATGEYVASEVLYPARNNETESFPFLQSDIYSATQPAIFLLDTHYEVYVWLGWWPEQKNKLLREANAITGSAHSRWLRDKRLALETAQLYVKACSRPRTPKAYMVTAGTEHERFINQFPFWEVNEGVQEVNCKGRRPIPWRVEVEEELKKYSRTQFTLEELKKKPPPEGVDPARLETYLTNEDFKKVFRMTREQFHTLSSWRKTELKKLVGLF